MNESRLGVDGAHPSAASWRRSHVLGSALALALVLTVVVPEQVAAFGNAAGVSHLRHAYTDCVGGGAATTAAMLQCAHDEFVFQDDRLNRNYRSLMSSLSASEQAALRKEEREWLARKKAKCALLDGAGTADQVASADCEVTETEARATTLER